MRDEPKNDDLYASNPETPVAPETPDTSAKPEVQPQTYSFNETANEPAAEPTVEPASQSPVQPTETVRPSQPEAIASVPVVPQPSKKRKNLIKAAIIAGALLLLGGIGGSVYAFWYQNPEKVVTDALVNALTAKTMSATGTVDIEGSDGYKVKVEVSGRNSAEGNSTLAAKLTIDSGEVNATINAEGIFSKDGDIYVKLKDVQKLINSIEEQSDGQVSYDAFSSVIKKVDGTWVKIDNKDLNDVSSELQTAQKCFSDITKSLNDDEAFRKSVLNETEKLYKDNKFIVIDKSLGSRTINGQGSLGYAITADRTKADTFFTGFENTELGKKMKSCDKTIEFDKIADEYNSDTTEEKPTVELWVSRFGHTLTEASLASSDKEASGKIVINPIFNKSEAVTVPGDSIGLDEVVSDIEKAYEDMFMSYSDDMYSDMDSTVNYN